MANDDTNNTQANQTPQPRVVVCFVQGEPGDRSFTTLRMVGRPFAQQCGLAETRRGGDERQGTSLAGGEDIAQARARH